MQACCAIIIIITADHGVIFERLVKLQPASKVEGLCRGVKDTTLTTLKHARLVYIWMPLFLSDGPWIVKASP